MRINKNNLILIFSGALAIFNCFQILFFFNYKNEYIPTKIIAEENKLEFDNKNTAESFNGSILGTSTSKASSLIIVEAINNQAYYFDIYLRQQNSPLAGYGNELVNACKRYNTPTDCTLLIAIAKVETDLCKTDISAKQYNCWGFGGSGRNRIIYKSFAESIDNITRRLMSGYGENFFKNPNNGGLSYCGRHCVNWGNYVKAEQNRLNLFFIANNQKKLF